MWKGLFFSVCGGVLLFGLGKQFVQTVGNCGFDRETALYLSSPCLLLFFDEPYIWDFHFKFESKANTNLSATGT